MIRKKPKASVLVVTLIILGIITVTALSISLNSIRERKASIGSGRSGAAYQAAETGVENVLNKLLKNQDEAVGDLGLNCSRVGIHAVLTGSSYTVELKKENEEESTNCSTKASEIATIKSVGNDSNNQEKRAIEAAVAALGGGCYVQYATDIFINDVCSGDVKNCNCIAGFTNQGASVGNWGECSINSGQTFAYRPAIRGAVNRTSWDCGDGNSANKHGEAYVCCK